MVGGTLRFLCLPACWILPGRPCQYLPGPWRPLARLCLACFFLHVRRRRSSSRSTAPCLHVSSIVEAQSAPRKGNVRQA